MNAIVLTYRILKEYNAGSGTRIACSHTEKKRREYNICVHNSR